MTTLKSMIQKTPQKPKNENNNTSLALTASSKDEISGLRNLWRHQASKNQVKARKSKIPKTKQVLTNTISKQEISINPIEANSKTYSE